MQQASSPVVTNVHNEERYDPHAAVPDNGKEGSVTGSPAHSVSLAGIENQKLSSLARIRLQTHQPKFSHPKGHDTTSSDVLVDFDGPDDPYRPMNWQGQKKFMTLIVYGLNATFVAFNSAIFSTADRQVSSEYGVSSIVVSLTTTMVLLGFALGPLLWAPLSEVYGRKYSVLLPCAVASFFCFGCGAARDIETILITRFFQGAFSSGVITNTGGVLADVYAPKERGTALIIYSLSVVGGPLLAPIVGSAIVNSYLGWRWNMYIVGILQIFMAGIALLLVDETYAPVLLLRKARQLRYETGNWALHAKHEEWNVSMAELTSKYLTRPLQLMTSPIGLLVALYGSFVYGLIYGSLSAIPIVFEERRGWSPVVGSLPFLALLLGCVIGLASNGLNQKIYIRAVANNDGKPVPEARLYPMMAGSFVMAGGLFVFAWTGDLDVIWVVPCIGILLIGAGFFPIFQASLNYIIDTFLPVAASAVAALIFMRSIVAAAFPIFMGPMLRTLGVAWGLSLLGFVSVAMLPVPFLFYIFGPRIRAKGRFSSMSV